MIGCAPELYISALVEAGIWVCGAGDGEAVRPQARRVPSGHLGTRHALAPEIGVAGAAHTIDASDSSSFRAGL